jgi:hypothetical protein
MTTDPTIDPVPQPDPVNLDLPETPAGWGTVVCDEHGTVLAGWTTDERFHIYAPVETVVRALMVAWQSALPDLHTLDTGHVLDTGSDHG